jgi:hypothetical protein
MACLQDCSDIIFTKVFTRADLQGTQLAVPAEALALLFDTERSTVASLTSTMAPFSKMLPLADRDGRVWQVEVRCAVHEPSRDSAASDPQNHFVLPIVCFIHLRTLRRVELYGPHFALQMRCHANATGLSRKFCSGWAQIRTHFGVQVVR